MADVWTPEQFEHALKTFGNFCLAVKETYADEGQITEENKAAGATHIKKHLDGLTDQQLDELYHFIEFVLLAQRDVQLIINMIKLQRRFGINLMASPESEPNG